MNDDESRERFDERDGSARAAMSLTGSARARLPSQGPAILPAQPPPHALPREPEPSSADRFRRRRSRLQDTDHTTVEALRNATALRRRTGDLDASGITAKFAVRQSIGVALRDLSLRCHGSKKRRGVSSHTGRVIDQCQTYTHVIHFWCPKNIELLALGMEAMKANIGGSNERF